MRSKKSLSTLFTILALLILLTSPLKAYEIDLGDTNLTFNVPKTVGAYEFLPIEYELKGSGEVVVQAVTVDSAAHEQYFDSAIPNRVAFSVEYLGEESNNATFKITNTGNTIWKCDGYGRVLLGDRLFPQVYLDTDVAPGESVIKTFPIHRLSNEKVGPNARRFVVDISRGDTVHRVETKGQAELTLPNNKVGQKASTETILTPKVVLDEFDELGHAFSRHQLNDKPVKATMKVQTPHWANRLVVKLIKNGEMKAISVPITVDERSLRVGGTPNTRWTMNGKPIFIVVNVPTEEIPFLREKYGTDNIVLTIDWNYNADSSWMKAVREHGYKIFPYSLMYVRLQIVAKKTGQKLMQGAPPEFQIERVDALDPNFHNAMADFVDHVIETAGDVLYRTADGKIPICLSGEQGYGFPWASAYPTRWGGGNPGNVAAFRVWLREKYEDVDKLNAKWGTSYKTFEEIDPTPICYINPQDYPDPWKEWGPALEDFDLFRSKIHGEFWARTVAEIKKRHPDVLCGMNFVGDYASDDEIIYNGFFDWGVKDYQGKPVNWMARRTANLVHDQGCFDFINSWNIGNPAATKKNIDFWRSKGKEVVTLMCSRARVFPGGDHDIRSHALLSIGMKGMMVNNYGSSFFSVLKTAYEDGGVVGALNDPYIGTRIVGPQRWEIQAFNKEVLRTSTTK